MIICYSTCWACKFGEHYEPPQVHTWMDDEDAMCEGLTLPLEAGVEASRPCGCPCARPERDS